MSATAETGTTTTVVDLTTAAPGRNNNNYNSGKNNCYSSRWIISNRQQHQTISTRATAIVSKTKTTALTATI
jgi:hypothetical protein